MFTGFCDRGQTVFSHQSEFSCPNTFSNIMSTDYTINPFVLDSPNVLFVSRPADCCRQTGESWFPHCWDAGRGVTEAHVWPAAAVPAQSCPSLTMSQPATGHRHRNQTMGKCVKVCDIFVAMLHRNK